MDTLCQAGIPAGAVLDCEDITNDEALKRRGTMVELDSRARGKITIPGFAAKMSENHLVYEDAPELGGSNEEIYGGILGLSEEDMVELKEKKVI